MSGFTEVMGEAGAGIGGLLNPLFGSQKVTTSTASGASGGTGSSGIVGSGTKIAIVVAVMITVALVFTMFKK